MSIQIIKIYIRTRFPKNFQLHQEPMRLFIYTVFYMTLVYFFSIPAHIKLRGVENGKHTSLNNGVLNRLRTLAFQILPPMLKSPITMITERNYCSSLEFVLSVRFVLVFLF